MATQEDESWAQELGLGSESTWIQSPYTPDSKALTHLTPAMIFKLRLAERSEIKRMGKVEAKKKPHFLASTKRCWRMFGFVFYKLNLTCLMLICLSEKALKNREGFAKQPRQSSASPAPFAPTSDQGFVWRETLLFSLCPWATTDLVSVIVIAVVVKIEERERESRLMLFN